MAAERDELRCQLPNKITCPGSLAQITKGTNYASLARVYQARDYWPNPEQTPDLTRGLLEMNARLVDWADRAQQTLPSIQIACFLTASASTNSQEPARTAHEHTTEISFCGHNAKFSGARSGAAFVQ